jgi:hypothetical protein
LQAELRDELEDAKYLFEGVELTEKEKADLRWGAGEGGDVFGDLTLL